MRIALIGPFRTLVDIDADAAQKYPDSFSDLMRRVADSLGQKLGAKVEPKKKKPSDSSGFLVYSNLDQDHISWYASPIVEIEIAKEKWLESNYGFAGHDLLTIVSASLSIFDNTVAIFQVLADIDEAAVIRHFSSTLAIEEMRPAHLEDYLTKWSCDFSCYLQKEYVEPFLQVLMRDQKFQHGRIYHKPNQSLFFDDITTDSFPLWPRNLKPLIWSHRVYCLPSIHQADEDFNRLLRVTTVNDKAGFEVQCGTSYVKKFDAWDKYTMMNVHSQFFYCMIDILKKSQRKLLQDLVFFDTKLNLRTSLLAFDRHQKAVSEVENELSDFPTGLQDKSRLAFKELELSFGTHHSIEVMRKRSTTIRDRLNRLIDRKQLMQQRLNGSMLTLVGGMQVVQTVINVFWYAEAPPNGGNVPGLVDLVLGVPLSFDLVLNTILIIVLIAVLITGFGRHRLK